MKITTARLSIFDKSFRPVIDPPQFLRECKRKFGSPKIMKRDNKTYYAFNNTFDTISVCIERN
jgi:hypothetical protein